MGCFVVSSGVTMFELSILVATGPIGGNVGVLSLLLLLLLSLSSKEEEGGGGGARDGVWIDTTDVGIIGG